MGRREFEDLVVRQLEAYTEKPADIHDLRNACRYVTALSAMGRGEGWEGWEQEVVVGRGAHVAACEPTQLSVQSMALLHLPPPDFTLT